MRVEEQNITLATKDSRNATSRRLNLTSNSRLKIYLAKAEPINLVDKFSKQSVLIRQKIKS